MPGTLDLEDNRAYSEGGLCHALGIRPNALAKARAAGELRSRRIGNRTIYMGRWVRDWIEGGAVPEPRETEAVQS